MDFTKYFIEVGIQSAIVEGLPFKNPETVIVRTIHLEKDTMMPDCLATVLVGNEDDYQTLGIYDRRHCIEIVGASKVLIELHKLYKPYLIEWLKEMSPTTG